MGKMYGYVRVSTKGQNIERQLTKLKMLGVEDQDIFIDKISGTTFHRPSYMQLREKISSGDLLYIDSIDRLGRNWPMTIAEWHYIVHTLHADIASLTETESFFDSRVFKEMGEIGQLIESYILNTLAFVADTDRKKKRDYQAEGIRCARLRGQSFGRPCISDDIKAQIYEKLAVRQYTPFQIATMLQLKSYDVFEYLETRKNSSLSDSEKQQIDNLAQIRKYSYKKIAMDTGVSIATVCNYAKKLSAQQDLSF